PEAASTTLAAATRRGPPQSGWQRKGAEASRGEGLQSTHSGHSEHPLSGVAPMPASRVKRPVRSGAEIQLQSRFRPAHADELANAGHGDEGVAPVGPAEADIGHHPVR